MVINVKMLVVGTNNKRTIIIQVAETGGRFGGQNFPAIKFAGKKYPDLAFSNVDSYGFMQTEFGAPGHVTKFLQAENGKKIDEFEPLYLDNYRY